MVRVHAKFSSKGKMMLASMNAKDSDTVGIVKSYLSNKIEELHDQELVSVYMENKICSIVDDSVVLKTIAVRKEIDLIIIPKHCSVVIKTSDSYNQRVIDITLPAYDIIKEISPNDAERHLIGFCKTATEGSTLNVCALSLPLCVQGWFYDTIIIIRRIIPDETTAEATPELQQKLMENANMAVRFSVSGCTINGWARLAALQFRIEGIPSATEGYIKQNIRRCIPLAAAECDEDTIISACATNSKTFSRFDSQTALRIYLATAVNDGWQCAYVEQTRVKISTSFLAKTYTVFVCHRCVALTKDYKKVKEVKIHEIKSVTVEGDVVTININNDVSWAIKSARPMVLRALLDEIIVNPYNKSGKPSQELLTLQKNVSMDLFKDCFKQSLAVVAPMVKHSPLAPSDFDDTSAMSDSFTVDEGHSKSTRGIPSSFVLDSIDESITMNRSANHRFVPPGIPVVETTHLFEANDEINPRKEAALTITWHDQLNISEKFDVWKAPTLEEFFGIRNNKVRHLVYLVLALYIAFVIIKYSFK